MLDFACDDMIAEASGALGVRGTSESIVDRFCAAGQENDFGWLHKRSSIGSGIGKVHKGSNFHALSPAKLDGQQKRSVYMTTCIDIVVEGSSALSTRCTFGECCTSMNKVVQF